MFAAIGRLACASVGTLCETFQNEDKNSLFEKCLVCDIESREGAKDQSLPATWDGPDSEDVFATIASLIKLPKAQKYRRPRVAATLALKRLLSHTANVNHLDLTSSSFGQWCLQALHSSVRELRIAAGSVNCHYGVRLPLIVDRRTLPIFLQSLMPTLLLVKNRLVVIDVLRNLSDQNDLALQETSILAWGQAAR